MATVVSTPLYLLSWMLLRITDAAEALVQAMEVWAYPGLFGDPRLPAPELGEEWKRRLPAS